MKKLIMVPLSFFLFASFLAKAQTAIPAADVQIKLAILAAPDEKRANATVMGFSPDG